MDDLTKQLLAAFQADGRASFVELAERFGVAETTVRRKYARLVETGLLRIVGVVRPEGVGYNTPVIIGLKVELNRLQSVVDELSHLRRVRYVALTTGPFDIVIMVFFKSNTELYHFIADKLTNIPGIQSMETLLVLETFKQSYDWIDPEEEPDL